MGSIASSQHFTVQQQCFTGLPLGNVLPRYRVEVDLPTAPANPLDAESPEPIVITVDKGGTMYLNIALNPDGEISAEALVKQVKAALSREPKRPVMVRGDANGPYQNVVATLVLLQQANVGSVGLVTDPEEKP